MNGKNGTILKVSLGFISTLIVIILGFALSSASNANAKADINKVDIRGMKVAEERTREDIKEMKGDIKSILRAVIK